MEQTEQWDNTYVLETIYDKQNYGIAFQKGKSQLRERINAALLTVQESGAFNDLQADYFGGAIEKVAEDDALGWWDGGPVWIVWSALIVVFVSCFICLILFFLKNYHFLFSIHILKFYSIF